MFWHILRLRINGTSDLVSVLHLPLLVSHPWEGIQIIFTSTLRFTCVDLHHFLDGNVGSRCVLLTNSSMPNIAFISPGHRGKHCVLQFVHPPLHWTLLNCAPNRLDALLPPPLCPGPHASVCFPAFCCGHLRAGQDIIPGLVCASSWPQAMLQPACAKTTERLCSSLSLLLHWVVICFEFVNVPFAFWIVIVSWSVLRTEPPSAP